MFYVYDYYYDCFVTVNNVIVGFGDARGNAGQGEGKEQQNLNLNGYQKN